MNRKKKVLVGMSGGVDSSVAAALLKENGYLVTGVFMKTWDGRTPCSGNPSKPACYGPDERDEEDAREVARLLGIKLHVIDLAREYRDIVLGYFKKEYIAGRTPNPCVICNRFLKFGLLPEKAASSAGISFDFTATGHYARAGYDRLSGRYTLEKGADREKDQSYFLFLLTEEQISRLLLPLGRYTKKQVRSLARKYALPVKDREESQDFISGNRMFLFGETLHTGPVADRQGNILGHHKGIINYTVGQRKGLGIAAGKPLYVIRIDASNNTIVVGEKKEVYGKTLVAENLNMVSIGKIDRPMKVDAKIRYRHTAARATVEPADEKTAARISFDRPQWAITPGQAVVFYKRNVLLGGGFIRNAY